MYRACMGRRGVSRKVYSSYGEWGSRHNPCSTYRQGCGAGPNLADLASVLTTSADAWSPRAAASLWKGP